MEMQNFKIGDREKTAGKIVAGLLIGGLGLLFYAKVLPFLLNIVWGTIELAIGIAVGAILLWILSSKKFWLGLQILGSAIGRVLFGWIVELDPWNVLQMQIDTALKDREELKKKTVALQGQEFELRNKLAKKDQDMKLASGKVQLLQGKSNLTEVDQMLLQKNASLFDLSKEAIDSLTPIYNDTKELISQMEDAYTKSGFRIDMQQQKLDIQKDTYKAVTTASSALGRAVAAFTGRKELNDAADIALAKLRNDIGMEVGKIKTSLKVTAQFMSDKDLTDAVKVQQAVETMKLIEDKGSYLSTQSGTTAIADKTLAQSSKGNKYLDMIK